MDSLTIVLCDVHKKPCLLKTGVKEGSNFGKSFYICGQNESRCEYVKATTITSSLCSVHSDHMVELQAVAFSRSTGEKRHYFRCTAGRREKKNWCGHRVIAQNQNKENPPGVQLEKLNENRVFHKVVTENALKDVNKVNVTTKPMNKVEEKPYKVTVPQKKPDTHRKFVEQESLAEKTKTMTASHKKPADEERLSDETNKTATTRKQSSAHSSDDSDDDCVVVGVEYNPVTKATDYARNDRDQKDTKSKLTLSKPQPLEPESKKPNAVTDGVDKETAIVKGHGDHLETKAGKVNGPDLEVKFPLAQRIKHRSQSSISSRGSCSSTSSSEESSPGVNHNRGQGQTTERKVTKYNFSDGGSDTSPSSDKSSSSRNSEHKKADFRNGHLTKDGGGTKQRLPDVGGETNMKNAGQKIVVSGAGVENVTSSQIELIKKIDSLTVSLKSDQHKKQVLEKRLQDQKNTMKLVNVSKLPDRGEKLISNIDTLEEAISSLSINIESGQDELKKVKDALPKNLIIKKVVGSQPQHQVAAGASQGPPKQLVQTKILAHTQPLPAHVFQQMYAANPQAHTLYGGRMTAARLKEVGSVTSEALERLHKQLETQPEPSVETDDPRGLNVTLMTHQRQALSWLMWREQQHPPGGILADDMGLGKTLTTISLILKQREASQSDSSSAEGWIKRDQQIKKLGSDIVKSDATLIVCPASLIHQWAKEIERRCCPGLLKVLIYHGANREHNILKIADHDVILTTYNIISKEVGITEDMKKSKTAKEMPATDKDAESCLPTSKQPVLLRIAWKRLVLDEAHCIKNNKSLTAMSVCRLRAGYRWALTGTPIQNDLMDMYSLLRFLRCSPFDEFKVWKRQVDNKSAKGTQRLNTLVKSLLLRRTKDQKGEGGKALVPLPKKSISTHQLKLSQAEKGVYDKIFEQSKKTLQNYLQRHEDKLKEKDNFSSASKHPWAGTDKSSPSTNQSAVGAGAVDVPPGVSSDKNRPPGGGQILLLLLRLRQCCSHMSLMKNALDMEGLQNDDGLELDIVEQMQQLALGEMAELKEPEVKTSALFETSFVSCKIKAVLELIKEVKNNSSSKKPIKSVVVSQWTQMLEVIEGHLETLGLRCCVIKGCIPPAKRMELVDTFNNDPTGPEVMLVSLRAGGVGLNLIGGNHLFLLDMHWNPALEDQACDRVYRVGQKKDVFIHRFVCQNTVEEKILDLQNRKKSLASNVLSGAKATANKLTLADLKELFGLTTNPPGVSGFHSASALPSHRS